MRSQGFKYVFPVALEFIGILMIATGVIIEVNTGADIGHLFITLGSVAIATGGLIWGKLLRKP